MPVLPTERRLLNEFLSHSLQGRDVQEFERYFLVEAYQADPPLMNMPKLEVFQQIQHDYGLSTVDFSVCETYINNWDEREVMETYIGKYVEKIVHNDIESIFHVYCGDCESVGTSMEYLLEHGAGQYVDCIHWWRQSPGYPQTNFQSLAYDDYQNACDAKLVFPYVDIDKAIEYNYLPEVCSLGLYDEALRLLKAGIDVNRPSHCDFGYKGETAIVKACRFRHIDVVRLLLQHGADVEMTYANRDIIVQAMKYN